MLDNLIYLCIKQTNKIMGQYYKPIVLDKESGLPIAHLYSHDYGSGLKLMEHSWLGNNFVSTFISLIQPGGQFEGKPIVWAGDYGDEETNENGKFKFPFKDGERTNGLNLYSLCHDNEEEVRIYGHGHGSITKVNPPEKNRGNEYRYYINEDKKEFVDVETLLVTGKWGDGSSMVIHPLPLLTCEGNGRGGGDYHLCTSNDEEYVGSWSRNVIRCSNKKPSNEYTQIFPQFYEKWNERDPSISNVVKYLKQKNIEDTTLNIGKVLYEYHEIEETLIKRYKKEHNRIKTVINRLQLKEEF